MQSQSLIEAAGIARPWQHQVELAELAHCGKHCAITTSTGSGKSLAYLMPVFATTLGSPVSNPQQLRRTRPSVLYLSPTKALAHDQLRAATQLAPDNWRATTLDGDSTATPDASPETTRVTCCPIPT